MSAVPIQRTDAQEAEYRAAWLNQNKAPKNWVVLTIEEVAIIRSDLSRVTNDWHRLGKLLEEYEHAQVGLKRDLARVTAERQNWKEWAEEARAMFHKQIDAAAVMKTRAEQAEHRNAELESSCRDLRVAYEQNASQCVQLNRELAMKPDTVEWLNGVTIQRQRAEQAEARVAELVTALREVDEIVNDANHSAEDRLCAAANRLLNTRAESATPAKQEDAR